MLLVFLKLEVCPLEVYPWCRCCCWRVLQLEMLVLLLVCLQLEMSVLLLACLQLEKLVLLLACLQLGVCPLEVYPWCSSS